MASVLLASPPSLPASPIAHVPDWVIAQLRAQNGDCYRQKGGYVAKNSENQQSYQLSEGVIRLNGEVYLFSDYLGGGSFGNVYVATNLRFPDKKLAVKVGKNIGAINENEQKRLAQRGYGSEYGIVDRHQLAIMNYKGKTLNNYLNETSNPIDVEKKFNLAIQLFTQLHYLHTGALSIDGIGITHHDIKPENVTVNEQGELSFIDLGLSALDPKQVVGDPCGTPLYLPKDKSQHKYRREQLDLIASFRTCFDYGEGESSNGSFNLTDPQYKGSVTPIFTENECRQHLQSIGSWINAHNVDSLSAPQYGPINYAALLVCQRYGIERELYQKVLKSETLSKAIVAKYYEINLLSETELQNYKGAIQPKKLDHTKNEPHHYRQIKNLISINQSAYLSNLVKGREVGLDRRCETLFDYTITRELGGALQHPKLLQILQHKGLNTEIKRGIAFAFRAGVTEGDKLQYLVRHEGVAKLITKLFVNQDNELIELIFSDTEKLDKIEVLLNKHQSPEFKYESLTKILRSPRLFKLAQDGVLNSSLRSEKSQLYYLDLVLPLTFDMQLLNDRPKLTNALDKLYKSGLSHDEKNKILTLMARKDESQPLLKRIIHLEFLQKHGPSLTTEQLVTLVAGLDGTIDDKRLVNLISNEQLPLWPKKGVAFALSAGISNVDDLEFISAHKKTATLVEDLFIGNKVELIKSVFSSSGRRDKTQKILSKVTSPKFTSENIIKILSSDRLFELAQNRDFNEELRTSGSVLYQLDVVLPKKFTASSFAGNLSLARALSDLYKLREGQVSQEEIAEYMIKNKDSIQLFNKIKGKQNWQKHFFPLAKRKSTSPCIFEHWGQFERLVEEEGVTVYSWSNQQFNNYFSQRSESRRTSIASWQKSDSISVDGSVPEVRSSGSKISSPQGAHKNQKEASLNYSQILTNLINSDTDNRLESKTFPLDHRFPSDEYAKSLLRSLELCKKGTTIDYDKTITLFRLHKYLKKFAGYASARNKEDRKSEKIKLVVEAIDKILQSSCEDYDTLKENIAGLNKVLSQNKAELTKPVNFPGITFFRFTEGKTQADRLERAITMFDELEKISDNTNKV